MTTENLDQLLTNLQKKETASANDKGNPLKHYPDPKEWDKWSEWDTKAWPKRVAREYQLIPTVCFNCESGCGLLAYVDSQTLEVKKFEGNPKHPGSRGRNCAKGPATINQIYDPERILFPLKRVGPRGLGQFKKVSWDEALQDIGSKMAKSRKVRKDGIMYHVGRPGEDHYTNRCLQAWGIDGHNSHTNICSAAARLGYNLWGGFDRPSPDHEHAKVILLLSSHLETGHYFNPHAQRIIDGKMKGAKLITLDPRLSNTASKSDLWISCWPGSEATILLSIANYLIANNLYDRKFVENWVNWREFLEFLLRESELFAQEEHLRELTRDMKKTPSSDRDYQDFHKILQALYQDFTFERAAAEAQIDPAKIRQAAEWIADCGGRLAAHTWRSASIGNLGGWQVARCLFFLNVLTGSVGTKGGTSANKWNKFVPKPFKSPGAVDCWNELLFPHEWPLSHYEMSFLLPHFLKEGRGEIDVYFTRVYNPLWTNPDGFSWFDVLRDEEKIKCHVALTPTWNETAWFADYVLPMGHASERHDLMSQETHASQWIAFRQPVKRVAMEKQGVDILHTYESNPGEVWEEAEFWVELSGRMDPDGELGIRKFFESPKRKGELITQEEYWGYIFEHSVPGLPEKAYGEGMTPLAYMRKYGCFEISRGVYSPYAAKAIVDGIEPDPYGCYRNSAGDVLAVHVDGSPRQGFKTPSGKLEFFSQTMFDFGWKELNYVLPGVIKSHVHPDNINRASGEMILLPNFRLPTLIHTRSANCKWLYEISHKNPVWMNPIDAQRLAVKSGDLIRVETETGYFVDKVWITEGIKPGIIAMSHHLGRWRLEDKLGGNKESTSLVDISEAEDGKKMLKILRGATPSESYDKDLARVWWQDVGVHQNLTHAVHPDPVSGAHCWLQKAVRVIKAEIDDRHGDVYVDTQKSTVIYHQWKSRCKSSIDHSPDGNRRPLWFNRPLRPVESAFKNPENPFGRS